MALLTWKEVIDRAEKSTRVDSPILASREASKQYFDWLMKNSYALERWEKLPRAALLKRITQLISLHLKEHKGEFVKPTPGGTMGARPGFTYDELVKKDPRFKAGLRNYFESPAPSVRKTSKMIKIIKSDASLKEKWNLFDKIERQNARSSIEKFLAKEGQLSLQELAPLTNFKKSTIKQNLYWGNRTIDKTTSALDYTKIVNGRRFISFFKDNDIEIFKTGKKGHTYFAIPNKTQQTALDNFENTVTGRISTLDRDILERHSRQHPLYKDTSQNLRSVLKAARNNLNTTIKGFNDKGLTRFLKRNPNMLKNASMWFNSDTGTFTYVRPEQLKPGFNFGELRKNLVFEIEHNRSVNNYWNKMSKDGRILSKYKLLNDAEFAHNLTIDTMRYNNAKESAVKWIERNPTKTADISRIETELGELGHRFYAGDQWRGRELKFKPGYKDTVMDSWTKALRQSSGLKLSDFTKNIDPRTWTRAMKEVEHSPIALRQLGTFLGCPRTFAAEGGRIGFQTGGTGLTACVNTKLKQPGALEKIAALPEEMGGALSKLKNTATTFLGMMGKVGAKAAPFAALAVAGAAIEPLVKQFRNDDPTTYLTDESQMKGMLLATIEGETPKVDEEILKWQYPGLGAATAAGAIPGAGEVYKARRGLPPTKDFIGPMKKGVGPTRAALGITGVLGKALGATFSPLAVLATLPVHVAAQRAGGTDYGDIATDPMNWMGPAFASTGAEMATRGMKDSSRIANAIRLGFSPKTLSMFTRRFGLPGLAVSAGLWGYDKWKNRSINDE